MSASIPEPSRWHPEFDSYEITDAVVAITRHVFGVSARLVCAAHPTIAPLLMTAARAYAPNTTQPHMVVYQPRRLEPKDAHDVYRLLAAISLDQFAEPLLHLLEDPLATEPTRQALRYLPSVVGLNGCMGSGALLRGAQT